MCPQEAPHMGRSQYIAGTEIRNPKHEIRNNVKGPKLKNQKFLARSADSRLLPLRIMSHEKSRSFGFLLFDFVSIFLFRLSCFITIRFPRIGRTSPGPPPEVEGLFITKPAMAPTASPSPSFPKRPERICPDRSPISSPVSVAPRQCRIGRLFP
jgi:hypothetical protein